MNLVSMSLHLLSISSVTLAKYKERILPRCKTVLKKTKGTPQNVILGGVDEPVA